MPDLSTNMSSLSRTHNSGVEHYSCIKEMFDNETTEKGRETRENGIGILNLREDNVPLAQTKYIKKIAR